MTTIKEEQFKYAPPLSYQGISASVDTSGMFIGSWIDLGNEWNDDLIGLSPDEARRLRDWLNEVLP